MKHTTINDATNNKPQTTKHNKHKQTTTRLNTQPRHNTQQTTNNKQHNKT